jgi:hypothetical protein
VEKQIKPNQRKILLNSKRTGEKKKSKTSNKLFNLAFIETN